MRVLPDLMRSWSFAPSSSNESSTVARSPMQFPQSSMFVEYGAPAPVRCLQYNEFLATCPAPSAPTGRHPARLTRGSCAEVAAGATVPAHDRGGGRVRDR